MAPLGSALKAGPVSEPHIVGDRDFVLEPGARNKGSLVKAVASYIPGLASRVAETVETSQNPFFLLQHRVPIDTIIAHNRLGLDHFLQVGVTVRDFLQHGYTWDDLTKFEDISSKGSRRALQAICTGLKATANDFKDYPDAFPVEAVQKQTQFKRSDLCSLFGLTFPEAGGLLECHGNQNWNALDCAQLGVRITDLMDFGMGYVHQYEALFDGISQEETLEAEKQLRVKDTHLEELIDLEEELRLLDEKERAKTRRRKPIARQPMPIEEEEEEEEEEVIASPRREFKPPKIKTSPKPKIYEIRSKQRTARHGALIK